MKYAKEKIRKIGDNKKLFNIHPKLVGAGSSLEADEKSFERNL